MPTTDQKPQRGQVLVLFTLALAALVLGAAVVVDGGYAFAQRRETQNAADFAAMAGTRIVGMARTGQPVGAGTATNVRSAITETLAANDAELVTAQYVDDRGGALGDVFAMGSIPGNAFGTVVEARSDWRPFLLGVIGVTDWAASAQATALTRGRSIGGGVMPVGINAERFDEISTCQAGNVTDCTSLTPGTIIDPGQFGWMKFGLGQKCDWGPSLGMRDGGCRNDQQFLEELIGDEFTPADSYGCCTAVGVSGPDLIGGLPGNKTDGRNLNFYIENEIPVWVPIYDKTTNEQGAHADYHIIGFGAIVFTEQNQTPGNNAKWVKGVAIEATCTAVEDNRHVKDTEGNDLNYCIAPDGTFTVDATGVVRLTK
jgi:hypothetical protein